MNMSLNGVCLFPDMKDWLRSDFEEDPVVEPKPKSTAANASAAIRREKQLEAEAAAAIADSSSIIEKYKNDSNTTILIEDTLPIDDNEAVTEIKVESEDVSDAIQQLKMIDDNISDSYDDLSDLIEKM
ncbi:unnamed protein product [Adineta ricciae]|nr:unnamed protein product [Adineta ricciae]